MPAIVVPFRGADAKRRVAVPAPVRVPLARELGADVCPDPGGGQGAAVQAALAELPESTVLVVNADLPCVVPHDLRALAATAELGALGLVEAHDGTTNALALPTPAAFAPLYGRGSAARFRARAEELGLDAVALALPNLAQDVDRLADLDGLALRAGPRT